MFCWQDIAGPSGAGMPVSGFFCFGHQTDPLSFETALVDLVCREIGTVVSVCDIKCSIHIGMGNISAPGALEPLPISFPECTTPAAPFRCIGGVNIDDRDTPVSCPFFYKPLEGKKRSVFKRELVVAVRPCRAAVVFGEEAFELDSRAVRLCE